MFVLQEYHFLWQKEEKKKVGSPIRGSHQGMGCPYRYYGLHSHIIFTVYCDCTSLPVLGLPVAPLADFKEASTARIRQHIPSPTHAQILKHHLPSRAKTQLVDTGNLTLG